MCTALTSLWCIMQVPHILLCDWSQLHRSNQRCCRVVWCCMITDICVWFGPTYSANLAYDVLKEGWLLLLYPMLFVLHDTRTWLQVCNVSTHEISTNLPWNLLYLQCPLCQASEEYCTPVHLVESVENCGLQKRWCIACSSYMNVTHCALGVTRTVCHDARAKHWIMHNRRLPTCLISCTGYNVYWLDKVYRSMDSSIYKYIFTVLHLPLIFSSNQNIQSQVIIDNH